MTFFNFHFNTNIFTFLMSSGSPNLERKWSIITINSTFIVDLWKGAIKKYTDFFSFPCYNFPLFNIALDVIARISCAEFRSARRAF